MHLRRLKIKDYKNLKDFEILFSEYFEREEIDKAETPIKAIHSHAVIGQNGTGKSNLIEAIITIFRDVDLNNDASFDYELDYNIRGHEVSLAAELSEQKRPFVTVNGKQESQGFIVKNKEYLPAHIFTYYSGRNERLEPLFQAHQQRFNKRQEITADEVLPERVLRDFRATESQIQSLDALYKREERRRDKRSDDKLRRLFYCRGGHSQLVLLACLLSEDPVFERLLSQLGIESLEFALFVLKQPYRLRSLDERDILEGDPRFWYARGNVVDEFLDKLWQVAWAPIEHTESKLIDFRGRKETQKQLYLFVPNKEKLAKLGELVGTPNSFFRYAEGAYVGDLIEEVRITVKKRDASSGDISFTQLSEGELQMLTVLGLMRITSEDHCLFLLDEPDTHLNPAWKLRYFDEIERVIRQNDNETFAGESQIIITTHDPLMIGSLRREQVRILRNEYGKSVVEIPDEHPQGMGVAGLLKSEMFGLPSTLDLPTLDKLQRRNELLAQKANEELTAEESAELSRLREYLDDLGFSREYRDPMYQMFIQKMYEVRSQPLNEILSADELKAQESLAEKIVTELVKHEKTEELSDLAKELQLKLEN
jgi:predicted ATPase